MAKLSTQFQTTTPARISRSERKKALAQQQILEAKRQQEFDTLKTRAEKVQQEKLSNVQSISDYEEVYQTIDPELQQFFSTPSELRTSQASRIEASKSEVRSQIQSEEQRLNQLNIDYQKSLSEVQNINPKERSSFKQDIEKEYSKNKATVEGRLQGLREGLGELETGKDLSVQDISRFARRKGAFEQEREIKYIAGRSERLSPTIKTTVNMEKYVADKLKGLVSSGITTVRNVTGGQSDVETLSVQGGEKIQVVREQDTGKVYITDLEGAKKGERIEAQGLSDAEISAEQKLFEKEQNEKAQKFLEDQGLTKDIVVKDISSKDSFGRKTWNEFQTVWATLFPHSNVVLPEEAYKERTKTVLTIGNTAISSTLNLDPYETYNFLSEKGSAKKEAEYQAELINKLNVAIEEAPEELKYYVQESGLDLLSVRGELASGGYDPNKKIVVNSLNGEITFTSKAIEITSKLKTYPEYIIERDYNVKKENEANRKIILETLGIKSPTVKEIFNIKEQTKLPENIKNEIFASTIFNQPKQSLKITQQQKYIYPEDRIAGLNKLTIVTGKAVEIYATGKLIGAVIQSAGYVTSATKNLLTGGIPKGVTLSDAVFKGGKLTATLDYTQKAPILQRLAQWESAIGIQSGSVDPIFKKLWNIEKAVTSDASKSIISFTGKTTLIGGVGGLYSFSKYKRSKSLKERYGDELGSEIFKTELAGELLGFSVLTGEALYKSFQNKKLEAINKKTERINYLKEQKAEELKRIKEEMDLGISRRGKKLSYREVGIGEKVLTEQGQNDLAKVYSKVNHVSKTEALRIVKETSIYEQSYSTKSNVPAINREIARLQGKKVADSVDDILTFKKYGFSQTGKVNDQVKSVAFEWTENQGRVANIGYKVSFGKGKNVLTGVYERARYSPTLDMRGFRLKKLISTKALNIQKGNIGDLKIEIFEIDNRLLKTLSGQKFLSQTRISGLDLYRSSPYTTSSYINNNLRVSQNYLDELAQTYKMAGKESTTSYFKNVRLEFPTYDDYGIIKIMNTDKTIFIQAGKGTPYISTRIGIIKNILSKSGYNDVLNSIRNPMKTFDVSNSGLTLKGNLPKSSTFNTDYNIQTTSDQIDDLINSMKTSNTGDKVIKEIKNIIRDTRPSYVGGTGGGIESYYTGGSGGRGMVSDQVLIDNLFKGGGGFSGGGGGLDPKIIVENTIRSIQSPVIDTRVIIKDLINIKSDYGLSSLTGTLLKGSLQQQPQQKQQLGLKYQYKFGDRTKDLLDMDIKSDMTLKQKVGQKLATQQVQKLTQLQSININKFNPSFNPYIINTPKMPVIPIIPFWLPTAKSKLKKKLRDKKLLQQFAYLPDFTSRSLGLEPKELTESQALKQIKKIQTGFELRRGIRIKPNKLLKGIPN